ncbi:transposase [Streptomyces phaeochromogenes]|uniref:transposase n=1 Tax=Streptomyces phaeochromogenes TaxID=1923 RepID=UPI003864C7B3
MWTWAGVIRRMPSGNDCGRSCRSATGVVAGGGITRQMIDGIPRQVWTGAQWRNLPERSGLWKIVYKSHRLWSADGSWERLLQQVQAQADAAGEIDWDTSVDSTIVRAHQHAAGARTDPPPAPPQRGTHPKPGRL